MHDVPAYLIKHGYAVIFALILAGQLGFPLPAAPILLAAGALSRSGQLSLPAACALAVGASLIGHLVWYEAGKRGGSKILRFICRISLEPDSCVRQTQNLFARYGPKSLIVAPFVPGLGSVAQPLAGMSGISLPRFLALDLIGSVLLAVSFSAVGYAFSEQLERAADVAFRAGAWFALALAFALGAYLGSKLLKRRKLLRDLRVARISPQELKGKLDAGEAIAVVDLRSAIDFQSDPTIIPGAIRVIAEELDQARAQIPREKEIVLYCT